MTKKKKTLLDDQSIKYWLLAHSNRLYCWIIESQIDEITSQSQYIELDQVARTAILKVKYTYAACVKPDDLLALVEDEDANYAIIRNQMVKSDDFDSSSSDEDQETTKVVSTITRDHSLKNIIKNLNNQERQRLNIFSVKHMKLASEIKKMWSERTMVLTPDLARDNWLPWLAKQTEHLDLLALLWIKPATFDGLTLKQTSLTLNQNFQIDDFSFLTNFTQLNKITLINMPHLKNEHIEQIVQNAPHLKHFNLHHCPKVNLKLIIPLINKTKVTHIYLNQSDLVCQLNTYASLLDEAEINDNHNLTHLLISSTNLTMDVCDQLLKHLPKLDEFIVHPKVFVSLQQNLNQFEDPGIESNEFAICSLDKKVWRVKRPFKIKNLLKDQYADTSYSESMLSKIKDIEDLEALENDPELLAEVMAEMKANGELSNDDS